MGDLEPWDQRAPEAPKPRLVVDPYPGLGQPQPRQPGRSASILIGAGIGALLACAGLVASPNALWPVGLVALLLLTAGIWVEIAQG